ncbi:unnamed protein product [Brassica napus]|uniref:(rape) hypothetical protein n=1 Tax=Brassica napus TaxID=3708 RepID=A0A816UXF9_BRANA|nr:unnamed protein product [Brassica napus]
MIHEFEQLRVSGLMTNAPYMLNVDCDMYANEADVVRQAMCVFLQKSKSPDRCAFVQFPQEFYDSNSNELAVVQSYLGRGVAGIQGPLYCGSGCFHTRRVMYGLSPDDLENNGDLSSAATKFLDEDSLARKFGSSKELLGCLYDSVAEDMNTSIGIHLRGWSSSYICPDPPAFLGSTPSVGFEAIVQQRRWGTGAIEVLFNKQSPLRGMFSSKIRFRQRLAYLWVLMFSAAGPPSAAAAPPSPPVTDTGDSPATRSTRPRTVTAATSRVTSLRDCPRRGNAALPPPPKLPSHRSTAILLSLACVLPAPQHGLISQGTLSSHNCHNCGDALPLYSMAIYQQWFFSTIVRSSCHHEGGRSGLAENCACILVILLFPPFLKDLFAKGKYGIPLSTLSKAAVLAMIFVVFAVGY